MDLASIAIILVIVAWIIYRQVHPRRLDARVLIVVPVIVLLFILQSLPAFHPSMTEVEEIVITSAVSIVFGLLACRWLHVYLSPQTGKAMAESSWMYFLWWLASFVVKVGLAVAFGETSLSSVSGIEILLPLFFLIATRNAYLYWRAVQLGLPLY